MQYDPQSAPEVCGYGLSTAARCNREAFDFLMQYGKNTKRFEEHINKALFNVISVSSKYTKCMDLELLIEYGADINAKIPYLPNKKIQTPLTFAITVGNAKIIYFLLKKRAQIEVEDGISAYDYVGDISKYSVHLSKEHVCTTLDNHRRDLAKRYRPEVRQAVYTHLPQDPTGIVMQYVDPVYYPLMRERPLKSFEHDDNDGTKEAIEFEKYFCIRREDDNS